MSRYFTIGPAISCGKKEIYKAYARNCAVPAPLPCTHRSHRTTPGKYKKKFQLEAPPEKEWFLFHLLKKSPVMASVRVPKYLKYPSNPRLINQSCHKNRFFPGLIFFNQNSAGKIHRHGKQHKEKHKAALPMHKKAD